MAVKSLCCMEVCKSIYFVQLYYKHLQNDIVYTTWEIFFLKEQLKRVLRQFPPLQDNKCWRYLLVDQYMENKEVHYFTDRIKSNHMYPDNLMCFWVQYKYTASKWSACLELYPNITTYRHASYLIYCQWMRNSLCHLFNWYYHLLRSIIQHIIRKQEWTIQFEELVPSALH